jgi:hypothetical protein
MKRTFLMLILIVVGCKNSERNHDYGNQELITIDGYVDGTYCAEIDYYYSATGTSSTYTLEVEIEDNELTVIHWPNGGWLDSSHFSPPDISDGEASFSSDANVDYTVRIIGEQGECSLDSYARDEDDLIQEQRNQVIEEENRLREEQEDEDEKLRQEEEERKRDEDEERHAEEQRLQDEENANE